MCISVGTKRATQKEKKKEGHETDQECALCSHTMITTNHTRVLFEADFFFSLSSSSFSFLHTYWRWVHTSYIFVSFFRTFKLYSISWFYQIHVIILSFVEFDDWQVLLNISRFFLFNIIHQYKGIYLHMLKIFFWWLIKRVLVRNVLWKL
jgi:hypothetical protein